MQERTGPSIGRKSSIFRASHLFEMVDAENTHGFMRGCEWWVSSDRQAFRPTCSASGAFAKSKSDVAWRSIENLQSRDLLLILLADGSPSRSCDTRCLGVECHVKVDFKGSSLT
jgi:hypothetical protein